MRLQKILIRLLVIITASCAPAPANPTSAPPQTLTVFAAGSLLETFERLGSEFEKIHPQARVVINAAGSQQLSQQIAQGAPADVFASADRAQMEAAVQSGRISTDVVRPFASNRLVVVISTAEAEKITQLRDLSQPGPKIALAAEAVPVGHYTLQFLDNAQADPAFGLQFKQGVLNNVVTYEENVRSVLNKVTLGEADAGVVYATDAAGADSAKIKRLEIPDSLNVPAEYVIAPVSDGNLNLAQEFVNLVLSPEGQSILSEYGFLPAP